MTDKKTRIVSNLLSLILGAGIGAGCYRAIERIQHGGEQRIELEAPPEEVGGGVIINESEGSGMQLTATKLSSTEYAANGVSTQAESAYTLMATITPSDATNKKVDWSVTFVNPSSSWATGKVITDYVTITPSADGALSAVVECKKAFGEQIKVTVTSRDNAEVTANCTVDYVKKVVEHMLDIGTGTPDPIHSSTSVRIGSSTPIDVYIKLGTGTVEGTLTFAGTPLLLLQLTESFKSDIKSADQRFDNSYINSYVTYKLDSELPPVISDAGGIKQMKIGIYVDLPDFCPSDKWSTLSQTDRNAFNNAVRSAASPMSSAQAKLSIGFYYDYQDTRISTESFQEDVYFWGLDLEQKVLSVEMNDSAIWY